MSTASRLRTLSFTTRAIPCPRRAALSAATRIFSRGDRWTSGRSRSAAMCWCIRPRRWLADTEVTGPIKVVLYASSNAPDTDFTAKLVDVFPDGIARNLTDGILRVRYRDSLETPKLMTPGRSLPDDDRCRSDQQRVPRRTSHPAGDFEQQFPPLRPQPEHRRCWSRTRRKCGRRPRRCSMIMTGIRTCCCRWFLPRPRN